MLYLYKSHCSHILEENLVKFSGLELQEGVLLLILENSSSFG